MHIGSRLTILFNHESPFRGIEFVTRKITSTLAKIKCGQANVLELGNLDAKRDWGFARDYVEGMWRMVQAETPDDYVLATGATHSVRDFVNWAAQAIGLEVHWKGAGESEQGFDAAGNLMVRVNPEFYRPAEVELLVGLPEKAKQKLGWEPTVHISELVAMMAQTDLERVQNHRLRG
jgi:GDPmannose 4,6-dehydratase